MNILVLIVLHKHKMLKQHIASVFIANLALIDLLNLLFVMPFSLKAVLSGRWMYGNEICQANGFFGTLFTLASTLSLAVISLDRWAAVMRPLWYRARMTVERALQMIVYVWIQAAVFSLPPAWKGWFVFNERYSSCGFPSIVLNTNYLIYMIHTFIFNIGVSLLVMLVTYFFVFRVARSHSRRIACAVVSSFNPTHHKVRKETFRQREARTAMKISTVIGTFLVCHLPYAVVRLLELFGRKTNILSLSEVFLISTKWTVYLKSAINPFIYSLIQKRFRRALSEILFRTRRESQPYNYGRSTRVSVKQVNQDRSTNNRDSSSKIESTSSKSVENEREESTVFEITAKTSGK